MSIDLRQAKILEKSDTKASSKEDDLYRSLESEEEKTEHDFESDGNPPRQNIGKIIHRWRAPEFEPDTKSMMWYTIFAVLIFCMITYALFTNGPIMAITFILIGIVGYIYLEKDPRIVTFALTEKGVLADKEFYPYDNINSFWIFYEPPHLKILSLNTKASMFPFVHIPISDEDPAKVHDILSGYIEEIKQDPSLIDTIERVFHI